MRNASDFIIKPIISEKSFAEAKGGRYTFKVTTFATKTDIKNSIQKLFGVTVTAVYTANIRGSKTRNTKVGRKVIDTSYKKARVRLASGQKLDLFEEQTKEEEKREEAARKKAKKNAKPRKTA